MTLHTSRYHALVFAALVFFFCSCGRSEIDYVTSPDKGLVMASLYSDIVVKSTDAATTDDFDDYNFRYVGVGSYGTSEYYRYGDITWPMAWYFGTFRLQAESCTVDEADKGYGIIRYEGISEPFTVINGQTASASVTCSIANIRVNVNFDDKMFLSFKNFKLVVESVLAPVYETDENGNPVLVRDEQGRRTLEFDAVNKTGFYSLSSEEMWLRYTLYIMLDGADEFIERKTGYLVKDGLDEPAQLERGDYITFNVSYVGEVVVTEDIKFIVSGQRQTMSNGFTLEDYTQGSVQEDE